MRFLTGSACRASVLLVSFVLSISSRAEEKVRNLVPDELKTWTLAKSESASAVEPLSGADKPKDAAGAVRLSARPKTADAKAEPEAHLVSPEITVEPPTKLRLSFLAQRSSGDAVCVFQVIEPSMIEKVGRRDGMEEQERMSGHVNILVVIPKETREWKPFSTEFTLPKLTGPFRIYLLVKGTAQVDIADVKLTALEKSEVKKPDF